MKVLFRHTETPRDVDTLSTQNLSIGTLALPSFLELQLLKILAQSNESLPDSLAMFQEWRVGLLPKT